MFVGCFTDFRTVDSCRTETRIIDQYIDMTEVPSYVLGQPLTILLQAYVCLIYPRFPPLAKKSTRQLRGGFSILSKIDSNFGTLSREPLSYGLSNAPACPGYKGSPPR